ncbi:hypothetical protein QRX60_35840 [Amycolatopsis mongoliensis]|uniref:Lipoprotein n=1 Tax=Amycolatopsis mongoliensis TaxID=715475 RepID=A0A9Y2JL37_9PSEU|nr:hypothetical protein [Amycolatopsis sp. 4-36]WIX99391.1 hypothetical protein QRX60_35840 [Amycolatopsis sp. 4-36]
MEIRLAWFAVVFPALVIMACAVICSVAKYDDWSNHTDSRRSGRSGAAGCGAAVGGVVGAVPEPGGAVVSGSLADGRDTVVGSDDGGAAVGVTGAGSAVVSVVSEAAGGVSSANAGPAEAARQNAIADNTAAADLDDRDITRRLDSPGFVLGARRARQREPWLRTGSGPPPVPSVAGACPASQPSGRGSPKQE